MRILHVANFNTHKYGTDLYATDRKISAGLTRNGHFVYDFSYRDVCRNESFFRTTKLGNSKVNQKLLQACETICPELLLLGHSELIEAETLAAIKSQNSSIKIGLWYVDALFHEEKMAHVTDRLGSIDVLFATTGGPYLQRYHTKNTKAAFIPNIVDPAIEFQRAFAAVSYDQDFIFCGRDSGDKSRRDYMSKLQEEASKHLRCTFRGCLGNPPISGYHYLDFLGRSKMGLNISRRNDVYLYSSDRIAQLVGNGLLTFCPVVPGMENIFSKEQIIYFHDLGDLLEKIKYYHTHDQACRSIAEQGWHRAHSCYNGERISRYMLELLFDLPFTEDYEWRAEIF